MRELRILCAREARSSALRLQFPPKIGVTPKIAVVPLTSLPSSTSSASPSWAVLGRDVDGGFGADASPAFAQVGCLGVERRSHACSRRRRSAAPRAVSRIPDHDSADPLEADEGERRISDGRDRRTASGSGPLSSERLSKLLGVWFELRIGRVALGGDELDLVTAVENQVSIGVPDRKGARAEGVDALEAPGRRRCCRAGSSRSSASGGGVGL